MSFRVVPTENFARELKRLVKKHPGLKAAVGDLAAALAVEPSTGSPLGKGCYKIRLRSPDKAAGKSGGFRLITHVEPRMSAVFLLTIYDKSAVATISGSEVKRLLANL